MNPLRWLLISQKSGWRWRRTKGCGYPQHLAIFRTCTFAVGSPSFLTQSMHGLFKQQNRDKPERSSKREAP